MEALIYGKSLMIVPYQWIVDNVDKDLKTIASKMILFQGIEVFRVGLKNRQQPEESQILFFMAVDLNRIAMKVDDVMFAIEDDDRPNPMTMTQMNKENIGPYGCSSQLFTFKLDQQVSGKCTFAFRIGIESCVDHYSYQLCDQLAKDQLWDSVYIFAPDAKFIFKDKIVKAHKAILAARSPVFASTFAGIKEKKPANGHAPSVYAVTMEKVEWKIFEELLHFIYTGEPMGPLDNEELLKLADEYELTTLSNLCRVALKKIDAMQMVSVAKILNQDDASTSSSRIRW